MNRYLKSISVLLCLVAQASACSSDNKVTPDPTPPQPENPEVTDGKLRLYITLPEGSPRSAMGVVPSNYARYTAKVNGTDYKISVDAAGKSYVDVDKASNNEYTAVLVNTSSSKWYGNSPWSSVIVPYSQFYKSTPLALSSYPIYAQWTSSDGSSLVFKDGFALLDVNLKGSAKISSIKVTDKAGGKLTGTGNFLPSAGQLSMTSGIGLAVLNCTENGEYAPLSHSGTHFYIILAPGTYSSGLDLTICDSDHKMMTYSLGSVTLKGNDVKSLSLDYSPAKDLLWYEGFDNFVWGGDIMGGSGTVGYSPDGTKPGISDGATRTGYEDAFTQVDYDTPGSGFIQSNNWSEVNGKTVGESHQMSESYVKSRAAADWRYMFRVQEYQGCVAVGAGNSARGIMETPPMLNIGGIATIKMSFKICFQAGSTDALLFMVNNAGVIKSCTYDGKTETPDNISYIGASSRYIMPNSKIGVPSSEASAKQWHTVEVEVDRATSGTTFYFAGNDTNSGVHGFYIDDITVTKVKDMERSASSLRVLYWNIQNGMWADQEDNYKNFVAFVKKYDPDVCVWCEASSIYYTNTATSAPSSERFLPDGWAALAARYGHNYTALGGKRDNYPQEITSKYPITTLDRITDSDQSGKPISHGAAVHEITVGGKQVLFVTLHLWPQSYAYGVSSSERDASSASHGGDYYRQFEMNYLVKNTVSSSSYSSYQYKLMMGDFNSRSRVDDWYYNITDETTYLAQDEVINGSDMVDIIARAYPGMLMSSTAGNARIDYMYASPAMYSTIENAMILTDDWATPKKSPTGTNFYTPSDHRPILVDFKL